MILQPARVIAETNTSYLLETLPKSACPRCEAGKGCGGGILAQAFANKTYQLSINKNTQLQPDQLVQIGIKSSLLVRASLLLYLLPLILMIVVAIIVGSMTIDNDVYTVSGAFVGMIIGVFLAKMLSGHYFNDSIASPVLVEDEENNCWYQAD